jgi:hypothetical protein
MTHPSPHVGQMRRWSLLGRDGSAGDSLRHPLILAMLALWVINDHILKSAFANTWTGKLSDIASLAVFPLLPVCAYELVCAYRGRPAHRVRALLLTSLVATGAVMVGINISAGCAECYRVGLGAAQWPFRALWGLTWEGAAPPLRSVLLTMDPTDLWTLPALALPWWIGRAHLGPPEQETSP